MTAVAGLAAFLGHVADGVRENTARDWHRDATKLSMTCRTLHADKDAAWLRQAQKATEELVAYVTADPNGDPLDGRKLGALLDAGADPNQEIIASGLWNAQTNALQLVIRHHGTKDLELMLAAGASVADNRCLVIAVRRSLERVRMLLAAGAKPNWHSLTSALGGDRDESRREETEIVEALLEAGADPNKLCESNRFQKWSPLEWAFVTGCWRELKVRTIRALLGKGVLDRASPGVFTVLAAWDGRRDDVTDEEADKAVIVMQLLLDAGMDCNARIPFRGTPLMAICRGERHEELRRRVVRILLDAGADPNGHGVVGEWHLNEAVSRSSTPLMVAAQMGHATIVQELLDSGADPRLVLDGVSAYHLAIWAGPPGATVAALLAP